MVAETITKLIEFRGFNNIFVGLVEDDNNKYFLFLSKYDNTVITIEDDVLSVYGKKYNEICKFLISYDCKLNVILKGFDADTLFHIISLQNKEEYYTIVKVLETMHGR